ncbi:hypothetical protein MRX96_014067 [Rhipicephalus microplus]
MVLACCALIGMLALMCVAYATTNLFDDNRYQKRVNDYSQNCITDSLTNDPSREAYDAIECAAAADSTYTNVTDSTDPNAVDTTEADTTNGAKYDDYWSLYHAETPRGECLIRGHYTRCPPPTGPGLRRYTTVCTVSYQASGLPLPLGGECEIIYYDSLLLRPEDTFMGTFTNAYLKPIFDAANDSSHNVQFGMSIHAPAIYKFTMEVKSAAGMQHYKDHWQHNIYHWGVVNIHELILKTTPDIFKASLTILKELKETATAAGKNTSMVVGLFCKSTGNGDEVTEYLKTVYLPDGILVLGHLSYRDNNISDCTILPCSIIADPVVKYKNLSYMHSLNDSIDTVSYLQAQGLDTMYAVTVTMAGRWYKPRQPDNLNVKYPGKYRVGYLGKVEDYPQKAHVQDVCGNTSLEFTKHFEYTAFHLTAFAWDKKVGLTVTFESLEALQKKLCFAFQNHTTLLVGVSIYDANYDATPRNCTSFQGDTWARVAWIDKMRRLLDVQRPHAPGRFLGACLHAKRRRKTIAVDRVLSARSRLPKPHRTFI